MGSNSTKFDYTTTLTILRVGEFTPIAFGDILTLSPLDHWYEKEDLNQSGIYADISQVKIAVLPISISSVLGVTITSNLVISRVQVEMLV